MNDDNGIEALLKQSRVPAAPPGLRTRVLAACRPEAKQARIIPRFVKYALAASWVAAVALQMMASRQAPEAGASASPVAAVAAPAAAGGEPDILNGLAVRLRAASELSGRTAGHWAGAREEVRRLVKGDDRYDI